MPKAYTSLYPAGKANKQTEGAESMWLSLFNIFSWALRQKATRAKTQIGQVAWGLMIYIDPVCPVKPATAGYLFSFQQVK